MNAKIKIKEISNERIQEGNPNPWATSSTTHHKLVLWLSTEQWGKIDAYEMYELNAIREYVREHYLKSHPEAPIGRGILKEDDTEQIERKDIPKALICPSMEYSSEWTIIYYETIYYN